jgi:Protein of unknown function (DUF2721)
VNINDISSIAHVIQLAVAPVFLLTGIASILGVLSSRLGRITDRARILEQRLNSTTVRNEKHTIQRQELKTLWKRVNIINRAIRLCTTSALIVCLVVVTLFVGDYSPIDISTVVAILFVTAMFILIVGLLNFLREVGMATHTMRMGMEFVEMTKEDDPPPSNQ